MDGQAVKVELKAGDILVSSWGYEQTNVDFYVVTKGAVAGKFCEIKQIGAVLVPSVGYSSMAGEKIADPNYATPKFLEKAGIKKKVCEYAGGSVKITSYADATLWDGKPQYCSWYY